MAQLYAFSHGIKVTHRMAVGFLWALQAKPRSGITRGGKLGISRMLRILRSSPGGFCFVLVLMTWLAGPAQAGLSEAERITLDQPACAQMKSFSQDVTLINDELTNVRRYGQRSRLCDVLARAGTTIGSMIGYMQSHIGECTITTDSINNMATLGRQFEGDRRKLCRY
jgi:hypothetical protein